MVGFVNYAHLGAYMAAQFDSRWVETKYIIRIEFAMEERK
jgi:hypothetical protein